MFKNFHFPYYRLLLVCTAFFILPHTEGYSLEIEGYSDQQIDYSGLFETENAGFFLLNDNFFRRLVGSRTRRSTAQENSRSQRHNSSRPQRYSPPPSNSRNPDSHDTRSTTPRSSNMSTVRNNPKPPLYRSRRDQHQSLGFWELGIAVSTSHAISDIGGSKGLGFGDFADYHTSNFSIGGGLYGRYIMNDWFSMNLGMNYANLTAERDFSIEGLDAYRFSNDIFEFFGKTEFRPPALARSSFDLYGFVGIGVFFSDASIYDINDRLISAQDDYSQVQPFIPFGGGFSVQLTNTLKLGYEFGWRNTIFHYLDGVKRDHSYDHYFLNSLKIGFVF